MQDCWTSHQERGWGGYVLKRKIKRLKERLKIWNRNQYDDTFKKFKKIEDELNKMEESSTDRHLSPQEMLIRK